MVEERIELPFWIVGAEDTPIVFSNLMLVQHVQQEFIITFGQYAPPAPMGSPERRAEQLKAMPYVPVKAVARIGLTAPRMRELIEALQSNYEKWERGGGGQQ